MLDLNTLREEFATYLLTNKDTRWGLDAALIHVAKLAYEQGAKDCAEPSEASLSWASERKMI